jgi:hypothetical protein
LLSVPVGHCRETHGMAMHLSWKKSARKEPLLPFWPSPFTGLLAQMMQTKVFPSEPG